MGLKENAMSITLNLFEDRFKAQAHIWCFENEVKTLSFLLNNDLRILSVTGKNQAITFQKLSEERREYRPLLQKVMIQSDTPLREIVIEYAGSIQFSVEERKNWYNCITRDIVSLSWYSVWYPQQMSIEVAHDKVIITNAHKWFVVKAACVPDRDVWEYGDQGYDPYNVVAFRRDKMHIVKSPNASIYFLDDTIEKHAYQALEAYDIILDYFNGTLFAATELPVLDIA